SFPRQTEREGLCLSDYFLPADSSKFDVVAFQIVTVGPRADELSNELNARGEYARSLFVHGIGVSAAEGLAEWHHQRIRRELKIPEDRGLRYSFGYSSCPDLAAQANLFALLKPLPPESQGRILDAAPQIGLGPKFAQSGLPKGEATMPHALRNLFLAIGIVAFAAPRAIAATPSSGTLSPLTPSLTFAGGPFTGANPTNNIPGSNGPDCSAVPNTCDDYLLTLSIPAGYSALHPNDVITVKVQWP